MALQLCDNLHWCNSGGRAIFLDLEADRYFCLPAAANTAFLRLAAGNADAGDLERLRPLVARRMLVEGGPSAAILPPPPIEPPARDWPQAPSQRAGPLSVLEALAFELRATFLMRTRGLHHVLEAARRRGPEKRRHKHDQHRSIHAIVAAWGSLSYLTRVEDRCLVRALAMLAACRKKGVAPRLVFGVIAHPFAAHCWVQHEDAVLIGGYEQARLYTPILVIE